MPMVFQHGLRQGSEELRWLEGPESTWGAWIRHQAYQDHLGREGWEGIFACIRTPRLEVCYRPCHYLPGQPGSAQLASLCLNFPIRRRG